jgi:hypothetical protein
MLENASATLERLLVYIYGEADVLKRELALLENELAPEDRDRVAGTLAYVQSASTALLFAAMPDRTFN